MCSDTLRYFKRLPVFAAAHKTPVDDATPMLLLFRLSLLSGTLLGGLEVEMLELEETIFLALGGFKLCKLCVSGNFLPLRLISMFSFSTFYVSAIPLLDCCFLLSFNWVVGLFPAPKATLLKFLKATMTTVTLSNDCLIKEFLRMASTPNPLYWWTLILSPVGWSLACYLAESHVIQTALPTSESLSLSKMPSEARTMKSGCIAAVAENLNERMSG